MANKRSGLALGKTTKHITPTGPGDMDLGFRPGVDGARMLPP